MVRTSAFFADGCCRSFNIILCQITLSTDAFFLFSVKDYFRAGVVGIKVPGNASPPCVVRWLHAVGPKTFFIFLGAFF